MKGFFSKSATKKPAKETPNGSMNCLKHGNPGEMICECKTEVLCEECYDDH